MWRGGWRHQSWKKNPYPKLSYQVLPRGKIMTTWTPKNHHTYSLILLLLLLLLFIPKNIIIIIIIIIFSRTLRFFFISPTCEKKKNRETWHVATPYWISWRSKRGTYRTWLSEAKKVLDIRWPCGVRVRGEYTRWVDLVSVKYENVAPWETDTSSFAE